MFLFNLFNTKKHLIALNILKFKVLINYFTRVSVNILKTIFNLPSYITVRKHTLQCEILDNMLDVRTNGFDEN